MWRVYVQQHPRYGAWYRRVEGQPGWVVKTAVTLAVLTVVIPLVLLVSAALLVGAVAFALLSAVAALVAGVRGVIGGGGRTLPNPAGDGRRNVRVIRNL